MKVNNKPRAIAVVGPTGSGKTRLAIDIAKKYNGVIISADSRQVYKGLDIGTNKEGEPGNYLGEPTRVVEGIPQLLIDVAEPGSRYSLYDWLLSARRRIKLVVQHGKLPIITGGTGLYVSALISNWELGATDLVLRKSLEKKTLEELQEMADELPGGLNESDYKNRRRLTRFLEKNLTDNEPELPSMELECLVIANKVKGEELFKKSNKRFKKLFQDIIEESKQFNLDWLYSLGLDYKIATIAIREELSKDELLAEYNKEARKYIRRQQTWWKHHERVNFVNNENEAFNLVSKFLRRDKKLVE